MRKYLATAFAAFFLLAKTFAQADEGLYVGAEGGVNFLHLNSHESSHCKFDAGYSLGASLGYALCNGLRFETEVAFRYNNYLMHGRNDEVEKVNFHGKIDTWSFMANGYYDLCPQVGAWITPYFGGGVGCDSFHQTLKVLGENHKGTKNGFSWQLMTGLNYPVCDDLILALEYKFHMTRLRYTHNNLQNHSITISLRKFFDYCF